MDLTVHTIFERRYIDKGYIVIGIDEVGRGALAGPIAVGAFAVNPFEAEVDFRALEQLKLRDSKLLTMRQRENLRELILKARGLSSIGFSSVETINRKGIVFAFEQAARNAIFDVKKRLASNLPIFLLIDAFKIPYVKGVGKNHQLNIIKGDAQSFSIAAAAILAKVERDAYMTNLSKKHSAYMWEANKGYGTQEHIKAIREFGKTIHHRSLFVRNFSA